MITATNVGPVVLTADQVRSLPAQRLDHLPGTTHRLLWNDGVSMCGNLSIAAGHRLGTHAHRTNHHHVWVTDGHARIMGELLGPGSYAHVPAGVAHDIDATAMEGCTVFYLYVHPGS